MPLADSLGAFERLREAGKIRADRPVAISPPSGSTRRCDVAERLRIDRDRARCSRGTIWSNARSFEAELRDAALRHGLGVFPFYSLANGFLTGKYRSKRTSEKRARGAHTPTISRARACACSPRSTRSLRKPARRWRRSRWPGRWPSRRSSRRSPARPASSSSSELTAAMHLKLTPDQLARLDDASAETEPALPSLSSGCRARRPSSPRSRSRSPSRHRAPRTGCAATGSLVSSPPAASHFALGTPPTQKMSALLGLVREPVLAEILARHDRLGLDDAVGAEMLLNSRCSRSEKGAVLNVAGAAVCDRSPSASCRRECPPRSPRRGRCGGCRRAAACALRACSCGPSAAAWLHRR